MTAAFDTFMAQYRMTGSEKADGYTRDAFDGLTEAESETVFKLLESELPYSASWLFHLDPRRAQIVAQEVEEKLRGDGYSSVFLLQEYMVRYSGDIRYQEHMLEDYPSYIDRLKPLVVDAVGRTPANHNSIAFLERVVISETKLSTVKRAALRLLWHSGCAREHDDDKGDYAELLEQLTDEDDIVRRNAIDRIKRERS